MKTIALDFDGVLHKYSKGWTGIIPEEEPVIGALDFVKETMKTYKVVVFSIRAKEFTGAQAISQWLKYHGFPIMEIYHNKPKAALYIDDKGFRFTGSFFIVRKFIACGIDSWVKEQCT